jgi:Zn-dependent protease
VGTPAASPRRTPGGIPQFRLFGIDVSLHWMWFLVAWFEISQRRGDYSSVAWNIAEYCTLFLIVLMHEFGHALACKSVGGKSERIVLWPLGGIAFVQPPERPGAHLWSIAAGPLVNVLLIPFTLGVYWWLGSHDVPVSRDFAHFLWMITKINLGLLIFNMIPIFPLDGGQILRSLLWFLIGRARSLTVASVIGIAGATGVLLLAIFWFQDFWIILIALFGLSMSMRGLAAARAMKQLAQLPRHEHIHCPGCGESPPIGPFWDCDRCRARFDAFYQSGICPGCGKPFEKTTCPHCGQSFPFVQWMRDATPPPAPVPYGFTPGMPYPSTFPAPATPPSPPGARGFDTSKYFP